MRSRTSAPCRLALARRKVLAALLAAPGLATAQEPSSKPIRIIVPYAPGGTTDLLARILADHLGRVLGTAVVIENRSGAGGMLGTEIVARAPADGQTLLFANTGPIIFNPLLYAKLSYDPVADFAPVARVAEFPLFLVIPTSIPADTLPKFLDWARQRPGKVSFGSVSTGSVAHLAGEMLNRAAGLDLQHVPYRGGSQALTDLIAGNTQLFFSTGLEARPHVEAGRIRVLATTAHSRMQTTPDVPTFRELGMPTLDFASWFGLMLPRATPLSVRDRLAAAVRGIMAQSEVSRAILDVSAIPVVETPEAFERVLEKERRRWAPIVSAAGVRIE
ncbi:Bug family tripartite tricarboxylate transporter substrate binding protein [Roseomonas chloroacetimidivorans]|uniref:Bug family tripartite tricarboxylate transporter substrate binding protein n=1 Tax=Roseomonas chloroacetimidivorans TaxID=1766656 RepID=UPI003C759280